jgi:predicted HicB family RNase H-like nuclease
MDYLHYKGYTGSIKYSKADECFAGKVLNMNEDLILYEGKSIDELRTDFEAGIESYFESCMEMGIEPRKPANTTKYIPDNEPHGHAYQRTTRTQTKTLRGTRLVINR